MKKSTLTIAASLVAVSFSQFASPAATQADYGTYEAIDMRCDPSRKDDAVQVTVQGTAPKDMTLTCFVAATSPYDGDHYYTTSTNYNGDFFRVGAGSWTRTISLGNPPGGVTNRSIFILSALHCASDMGVDMLLTGFIGYATCR